MQNAFLYIGTYTDHTESEGIYTYDLDSETGQLRKLAVAGNCINPSFLTIRGEFLYACNEMDDEAVITAFHCLENGELRLLNELKTHGKGMCYLSLHPGAPLIFAANFGSGDFVSCTLLNDGRLGHEAAHVAHKGGGPHPVMQTGPHVHSVVPHPDGDYLVAADLGNDTLTVYRPVLPGGGLQFGGEDDVIRMEAGSGPRHFVFHPSGRFGYLVSELANTVTLLQCATGRSPVPICSYPLLTESCTGENFAADVHISRCGGFLYASVRGADVIAGFEIHPETGALKPIGRYSCGGKWPRHFCISPCGEFVVCANQKSDNITVLRCDAESGAIGGVVAEAAVPAPVCVVWK